MVRKIFEKTKNILFVDPQLLYKEDIKLIKKPFYFKGNNGKAVLLLHGWTTTPYEVRRLGQFLNSAGYTVHAPLLSGHGKQYYDLDDVVYQDWIDDSQKALDNLKAENSHVFVGGTSMGATLAMQLAKQNEDIAGLVLMATPYRLKFERIAEVWIRIVRIFKKYNKKFYPPTFGLSTNITRIISYQKYSYKSLGELAKLVKLARKDMHKISQPCLIMQSSSDHIITKSSLIKIYNNISSEVKTKKYVEKAYHTFISDIRNEHVFEDILDFIKENNGKKN